MSRMMGLLGMMGQQAMGGPPSAPQPSPDDEQYMQQLLAAVKAGEAVVTDEGPFVAGPDGGPTDVPWVPASPMPAWSPQPPGMGMMGGGQGGGGMMGGGSGGGGMGGGGMMAGPPVPGRPRPASQRPAPPAPKRR